MTTEQICKCGRTRFSEFDDAEFICDNCKSKNHKHIFDKYGRCEICNIKIFKVSCEYYIQAEDERQAQEFVADEGTDFFERHLTIEESECEDDDIFNRREND